MATGGHVRSASLPCHSHPVVMQVEEQLLALRSWRSNPGQNPLSLAHVRALLCVLDELLLHLHLPLPLRLADGFLVLADVFGSFLAALLALRQHTAELRAAMRRRDPAKIASTARAQRQIGKEIEQLAASVARSTTSLSLDDDDDYDGEVVRTVTDAINDTALASASVFLEVANMAAASSSSSTSSRNKMNKKLPLASTIRTKQQSNNSSDEKLQELEHCIGELETESEKVFRSLVQTRVSLLNIHTPTF